MKHETISKEHRAFLQKSRKKTGIVNAVRLGLLLLLLGLWELVTALNWADPFLVSSPSRIAKTIASLYQEGTLFYHIGITLSETLIGFVAAILLGGVIALLLWSPTSSSSTRSPRSPWGRSSSSGAARGAAPSSS